MLEYCFLHHASLPDHLSWVDCISCPPVRDLLILFPSTPVSREQIGTTSSCTLVGVLFESLPTAKASCPLCMNTFYYNSSSSLVRVRLDPTEWMQHIVEPPPTSWTLRRSLCSGSACSILVSMASRSLSRGWHQTIIPSYTSISGDTKRIHELLKSYGHVKCYVPYQQISS